MSPAASYDGAGLTRSGIENWDTSYLDTAATAWRLAAARSEDAFDQHRQNIASPGGTTWEGDAKDAALDRVTADVVVVGRQGGVLREAAQIAENGRHDINMARSESVAAIRAAEDDGFRVGEDLSVTDTKRVDFFSMRARQISLNEHVEDIRWYANRLAQADSFVGERLQAKAAELDGIKFDGEDEGRDSGEGRVWLVDNKIPHDAEGKDEPGDKKPVVPGSAPGQIGPFAVPKSVEDAAKKPEAKSEGKPSGADPELRTPHSLEDMLLPGGRAEPDPSASPPFTPVQIAEFKAQARKLLQQQGVSPDQIESRVDAMLTETQRIKTELDNLPPYTPPAGPSPARASYSDGFGDAWRRMEGSVHSLTGQNGFESFKDAWKDMGSGVVETVKDPYGTAVRGIEAEIEAFRNNPEYRLGQKGFDAAATAATLPFGGEAAAARSVLGDVVSPGVPHEVVDTAPHINTPSPHVDHPGPETPEAQTGHHTTPVPDGPVEHPTPPPVHAPEPAPVYHPPTPDVFDPNATPSYTSGDPHYPGGWPPGTPDPTWGKGDADPGWKHINHNFDKDWMPYQQQIGGVERTPDGACSPSRRSGCWNGTRPLDSGCTGRRSTTSLMPSASPT